LLLDLDMITLSCEFGEENKKKIRKEKRINETSIYELGIIY